MSFPIRLFGDPVLRQRAREVTDIDGNLARLVETMYDTMYEAIGVGLAAPQVGVQKRLFTYDDSDDEAVPSVIINPRIVDSSGEWVFEEGCLSIPGFHFEIVRPAAVTIAGLDLDGNEIVLEAEDRLARIFQHELDHLDGILMFDRVDDDTRKMALRAIREHGLEGTAREDAAAPRL